MHNYKHLISWTACKGSGSKLKMFLSVYLLKSLISVGIVLTLLLGILLIYVLVYAFLISSVTALIMPGFRNTFIFAFMMTSIFMILSSLSGIYVGLIRKRNKFVILYSLSMLLYFIVFIVLAAFMAEYPETLNHECDSRTDNDKSNMIQTTVDRANSTLCKTCKCYFNNIHNYSSLEQRTLTAMGFRNYSSSNDSLPINAEKCETWQNSTDLLTDTMIFLESIFNCSGWCWINKEHNLYYLFTDVNRGHPKQICIDSLIHFFKDFGKIMFISCLCISLTLFIILLMILCLCCHPDRGRQYDAMKFFKSTLMVELFEENESANSNGKQAAVS